jgi:hypothetical protein
MSIDQILEHHDNQCELVGHDDTTVVDIELDVICSEGCTDYEWCEHPAPGYRYRSYLNEG